MGQFQDLYEYNAWANGEVLAATDQMSAEALAAGMRELGGSALELLNHMAQVEAAFLALMTGGQRPQREDRPYETVRALLEANSAGYLEAMPGLLERLEEQFEVPWFERSFSIEQGLLQVATHSVQHRAGVCAGIARAGLEAPDLDYIMWMYSFR